MDLFDIIGRACPPEPWAEGDNIPWHEPGFSARMLREHLSQAHDAASRRAVTIDRHVAWIHRVLLGARPARILDLGCGPGLYSSRLARLGHRCVGVDYSPASIAHARAEAKAQGLACRYELADIRAAELGEGFDWLVFGVLRPRLSFQAEKNVYGVTGAVLISYAMLIYPALGTLLGHGYPSSPSFGVAPCPTTIFTFGLLLWTHARVPRSLLVIPLIWSLIGFWAAISLGIREDIGLLLAGLVSVALLVWRDRTGAQPRKREHYV